MSAYTLALFIHVLGALTLGVVSTHSSWRASCECAGRPQ